MTGPGYVPNHLPNLPIVGPEIAHRSARHRDPKAKAELCPLWRLNCAALYFRPDDPNNSHAADKSPALRTLLEDSRGHSISTIDWLAKDQNSVVDIKNFRDPALLAAVVTLGGRSNQDSKRRLDVFGEHSALVRSRLGGLDSTDAAPEGTQHHVLLAPAAPWPNQPPSQGGSNGRELWVPPMRLVAGRIPLRLELSTQLMLTLRGTAATGELFGGLPAFPANVALAADLTPDGIEFRIGMPDPVADLAQTPSPPDRRQVRLQPLRGKDSADQTRLGLALVDTADDERMDQAFAMAFAQLRRNGSPLRVDYDPRPEVAPLWWLLETQRDAEDRPVLTFPGNMDEWEAEISGDVFRMRLITGRAEGSFSDAVARANIAEDAALELKRDEKGTRLGLSSSRQSSGSPKGEDDADPVGEDDANGVQAEAEWLLKDGRFALDSASLHGEKKDKPAKVHAALHEAADRLGARYAARGLLHPGQTRAPHLFLPIVEGVAQIEVPAIAPPMLPAAAPSTAGGSLTGSVVLELSRRAAAPALLEIDEVAGHEITVSWPRRDPATDVTASKVTASLRGLRGVVRNLLWLAEESPDADRALPTGRIAPAATGPMPLYLRAAVKSDATDATLKLVWDAPAVVTEAPTLAWAARLKAADVTLWTRHPHLPLISAAEMLRSGDASSMPSPTRDLFPSQLGTRLDDGQLEGVLLFGGAPNSPLPSIYPPDGAAGWKPQVRSLWHRSFKAAGTQWGAPEIALVAPSAPGLEFRQTLEPSDDFSDGFAFETALRLDLPGLDELFAVAAPPRPARPEPESTTAANPLAAVPPATALYLDQLEEKLWRRREFAQAMTRTVAARATQWFALSASALEVHGLVEPWSATAKVRFEQLWTDHDGALAQAPLGGWSVEWDSHGSQLFTGDLAIAGLGGDEPAGFALDEGALVRRDNGPIRIAGFAAALFPDAEVGRDVDGAGLTLQRRPETSGWPTVLSAAASGRSWRAAAVRVRDVGMDGVERRLVSFSAPVKTSLTQGGEELLFWIRDLPLETTEANPNLSDWSFDAAQAGPERALGADPTLLDRENAAAAVYEWRLHAKESQGWGFELSGLHLRPLRLLSVTNDGFKTLCAVDLFDAPKASNARFGDDRPYRTGNLVRLDFTWSATGAQLTAVTRVRLKANAKQVSEATLMDNDKPLRFPVDVKYEENDGSTGEENDGSTGEENDGSTGEENDGSTGAANRQRADLLILPQADGKLPMLNGELNELKAALRLRLFGRLMRVDDGRMKKGVDEKGQPEIEVSFEAAAGDVRPQMRYGVSLQKLGLVLPARRGAVGSLSMEFSISVALPEANGEGGAAVAQGEKDGSTRSDGETEQAMLIEWCTDGKLTWLAADIAAATQKVHVDHARGVLQLRATNRDSGKDERVAQDWIEPIRGITYLAPQYEILLDMVFPLQEDDEIAQREELQLPIAFDSHALDASGRLIAGKGDVGATLRTEMRTEHNEIISAYMLLDLPRDGFEGANSGWLESRVVWPTAGLLVGEQPKPGRARRFETNPDPTYLRHEVRPSVTGWRVPLDALGKVVGRGASIGVARQIDILAPVDHRLTPNSGEGATLKFTTLDRITLLDASKLPKLAKDMLEVENVGETRSLPHGFAPRYTDSHIRYLKQAEETRQRKRTPHAGIARPSIAGGGFRDLRLLESLKEADGRSGLLVFGAAALAFRPDPDGNTGEDLFMSFGVPWVTASDKDAAPPALNTLQNFSTRLSWVASDVDLKPFKFELGLNTGLRGPRLLFDPPERAADLLAALSLSVSRHTDDSLAWAATEVLEPALFDAEEVPGGDINTPVKRRPSMDIDLLEWPLFLRSLVGLQKAMESAEAVTSLEVVTLLRPSDDVVVNGQRSEYRKPQVGLVAVRFGPRLPAAPEPESSESRRIIADFFALGGTEKLVVYSANSSRRTAPAPDTGARPGTEAIGSAALRDAAEALSAQPRLILLERRDADGCRVSSIMASPWREAAELGARAVKLRDANEWVLASSALGWPEKPFEGLEEGDLTLEAGPDSPVLAAEAGLSARFASFGFRPKAAPKEAPSIWFVSASRSRFLRVRDDVEPDLGLAPAPAPQHMLPPSVRARAPGPLALRTALNKVGGDNAFDTSAPVMPAGLLRGSLGRRPGVMEIGYDALMTERSGQKLLEKYQLDAEVPQSGVSATLGPGVLRFLRRPRSTALPRGAVFARRRRTFVSHADRRADGSLCESLVLDGVHVALRKPKGAAERDRRLLVELKTTTLDQVLKEGRIQLEMTLAEAEGIETTIMPFLAETGFFGKVEEAASLSAQLVAADLRICFDEVEWNRADKMLKLSFTLKQLDAENLAEAARTEAADLRIALQLASGEKSGSAFADDSGGRVKLTVKGNGSPSMLPSTDDMLELPVLAAPLDRPKLAYATRTAIFGDPAYDRELASRPQSDERGLKSGDKSHAFLFGLDRASHDLGAALNLAVGEVERSDSGAQWASKPTPEQKAADDNKSESEKEFWTFSISVQLQPYDPGESSQPLVKPLRLAKPEKRDAYDEKGDIWYELESQRRYAIPVAALYESVRNQQGDWTLGPPAALRPGDRLVLRVRVSRGKKDQLDLRAETLLTAEPSVGPPEAVYSLLDVIGDKAPLRARVALHAPGPMPRRVEFPDFLGDLLCGHIRRRGLFIWHEVDFAPADGTRHATLIKFDRSGSGQLPMDSFDFEPQLQTSAD
ncbi:hypothetical protein [Synechococcus sp. MIT S9507]|uniref:hypothetical protein n=1 Tax=Synechococcus sp. MIT S9507 TaxID=3082544 RepID=UPI0039B3F585